MQTPIAIFLGLALIAVAIFFRQPSISEAQASRDCATSAQLYGVAETLVNHITIQNNQ